MSFFSLFIFSLKLTSGRRYELNTIWSADITENVLGANMIESLLTFYIQCFQFSGFSESHCRLNKHAFNFIQIVNPCKSTNIKIYSF